MRIAISSSHGMRARDHDYASIPTDISAKRPKVTISSHGTHVAVT
jgi:hypothetical protein